MRKLSKNTRENSNLNNKKCFTDEKIKQNLIELYEKEFYEIFSEILILPKNIFFQSILSNIKKSLIVHNNEKIFDTEQFLTLIKSYQNKYEKKYDECLGEIKIFLEFYKKSTNKNENNYITNFQKHCLQTDYYAKHKCKENNYNLGFFMAIPTTSNKTQKPILECKSLKKEENSNIVKYVICMTCKKIYLSSRFQNYCSNCDINYLSHIFNINDEQNLFPALWGNNHCELILNDKILCSKCNNQIYIDIKNYMLKCSKCKINKYARNIERICKVCNIKYKSNILIYNPLEKDLIESIVNDALTLKIKAIPKNQHSCKKTDRNSLDYFHNNICHGKIYYYKYNNQEIIICDNCKKMYYYDKFIWICPYCKEIIQDNEKETKSKIIGFLKDENLTKGKYSIRIFYKNKNITKNDSEVKLKEQKSENEQLSDKNNNANKYKEINIANKEKQIIKNRKNDFLSFTQKEREKIPLFDINSHVSAQYTPAKKENKIINLYKDLKIKNELNIKENEITNSLFQKYKNNINKKYLVTEEAIKNKNDNNKNFNKYKSNETFNNFNKNNGKNISINHKKEKIEDIQINNDSNENDKKQKKYFYARNIFLTEKNKNIDNIETINKLKLFSEKKYSRGLQDNKFQRIISSPKNFQRFEIKNYLISNSKEKNNLIKSENNKECVEPLEKKNLIKTDKKYESKFNNNNKNNEQKHFINSISQNIEKNIVDKLPSQTGTKQSYFDTYKPSEKTSIKASNNNQFIVNNNNKDNNINSQANSEIRRKNKNYNLPFQLNTENNRTAKRERIKLFSPKKVIKLNIPDDIIEPENLDTEKDFPIDDPYLQSHPDLYNDIQNKLKEIMYKIKLPMFIPDLYKVEKIIGEGTHGSIFQVLNKKNGKRYAIKKIFSNDIILLKYIKKEFELVYDAVHPNILSIYGIHLKCFDSNSFSLSVLMDLGETDWEIEINEHLHKQKYYSEKELMSILKQLVSGLVYLQKEKKIAHRDVKPENVIIFKNNIYKLGDFGEAKGTKTYDKLSTLRGTDTYMSPILYNGLKMEKEDVVHDLYKSDVFSLGYSMLYAVSLNHDIIKEIRKYEKMEDIEKCLYRRMKPRYSDNFINIILKMVNPDENKRVDFIALDKLIN